MFYRGIEFPLRNVPVARIGESRGNMVEEIRRALARQEGSAVLAMAGVAAPDYRQVAELAEAIRDAWVSGPVTVCLEQDMAKALGHALAARLPEEVPILCIDRVKLAEESYLDVAAPVGPALPVVVKTLVLGR